MANSVTASTNLITWFGYFKASQIGQPMIIRAFLHIWWLLYVYINTNPYRTCFHIQCRHFAQSSELLQVMAESNHLIWDRLTSNFQKEKWWATKLNLLRKSWMQMCCLITKVESKLITWAPWTFKCVTRKESTYKPTLKKKKKGLLENQQLF